MSQGSLDKNEASSSSQRSRTGIAVIGVGAMFPDATNVEEYWKNIVTGHDSIRAIPLSHWRPEDYFDADPKKPDHTYSQAGGFLKPYAFDPLKFGIAPHAIEATDTTQLLGMVCAHEALVDAGYGPGREFNHDRTSCIIGVTGSLELVIPLGARLGHPAWKKALKNAGVADDVAAQVVEDIAASYVPWQENSFPGLLGNVVAGRIASRFDLGGSNAVVDAACASSLAALSMAAMELESGRADMVITGGMDTFNDIFMYMCFSKTPALSPTGHSRPFDADGDGTSIGEGLGAVILKRLEDAERDGDRIYAVIKGIGSGSDGKGQAIYAPAAKGQYKALTRAYEAADVTTDTIELIEAHGTGTKVGDGVEIDALAQVYGTTDVKHCVIGSVKSQIGHTKAAAGAAGLIKAVMAVHHKIQPPTLKIRKPLTKLAGAPFQVLDQARPWITRGDHLRRAAVSAFGFGGSNFHCVVEEYPKTEKPVTWDDDIHLFTWSAESKEDLVRAVAKTRAQIEGDLSLAPVLARQSRRSFSATQPHRLSLWAKGSEELSRRFATVDAAAAGKATTGIVYSNVSEPLEKSIGLVFAGQGSQAPGMLRELMLTFPEALESLEVGSRILREAEGATPSLMDYIYPSQAFSDDEKNAQKAALTATRIAQLALGTVGAALLAILKRFGVKASLVAGHSYGELLALYASGVLKLEDMLKASYQRGLLMEKAGREGGGMLAVMASAERVQALLESEHIDAVIANFNSQEQVVVGGKTIELERLKVSLKASRISCKSLEVSTAFHTDFVSDAARTFDAWLQTSVSFEKPAIPVYSNLLGGQYPIDKIQETLSAQLGAPVRFQSMIAAMAAPGVTLVEVGPGRKIHGLLKSADTSFAVDSDSKSSLLGLVALLAELSAAGHTLDLTQWHPGSEVVPVRPITKTFTVILTGANYRAPRKDIAKPKPSTPLKVDENPSLATGRPLVLAEGKAKAEAPRKVDGALPRQATFAPRALVPKSSLLQEDSMSSKNNQDWLHLENILREMQEAQRKTTDAHTLFLENQRQFQHILREALLGSEGSIPLMREAAPVARAVERAPRTSAPVREPASLTPRTRDAANPISRPTEAPTPPPVSVPKAPSVAVAPMEQENKAASGKSDEAAVFRIIADATGFPVEMLSTEMQLESDLGIDSIKKVEIFSQVQSAHPRLPADASRMNEVHSIADLLVYIGGSGDAIPTANADESAEERKGAWSASPVAFVASRSSEVRQTILEAISDKTGFPTEMLNDDMDLESDLGVDSIKKVEIFSHLQEKFPHVPFQAAALNELHKIADILHRINAGSGIAAAPSVNVPHEVDNHSILWDVIAEKTGYPAEVLTLSMDLESDLGIDSIKRVEILSALTERLPQLKDQSATEVRTLEDMLHLLNRPRGSEVRAPDEEGLALSLMNPEATEWDLSSKKKSINFDRVDDVPEGLEDEGSSSRATSSSNVSIVSSQVGCWKLKATPWSPNGPRRDPKGFGEIWIIDDGSALAESLHKALASRSRCQLISQTSAERLAIPGDLEGVFILSPTDFDQQPLKWLLNTAKILQRCAMIIQENQGFVVTVTRNGGEFGLDGLSHLNQIYGGGSPAFVKTIAHEWPGVHVRAVDMGRDFSDNDEAAQRCFEAAFWVGPLEIGVSKERALTLRLEEESFAQQTPTRILNRGDTVLVTGGARGVTATTLIALAKRYPVRFVIWGRTPLSAPESRETRDLTEPAAIKKQLLFLNPELSHPKDLEKAYRHILSQRELNETFAALRRYGAEVLYEVVDVSKDGDLRVAIQSLQERFSVIRGIIHGAGVIRDKLMVDQNEDELSEVLDTKLRLLPYLEQLAQNGTAWMVLFSSSTARLGRKGQGAYGLANEILNRAASFFSTQYGCRSLALNWGPWDGGMVHDGLKKLFASEGLGTIPLSVGASLQTYLLEHPSLGSGEWLVLGEGGRAILGDQIVKHERTLAKQTVRIALTPVLMDHVIKHRAVVPAALLSEWMVAAASPFYPLQILKSINGFQVWKGLILDVDTELTLEIVASSFDTHTMECIMRSRTPEGQLRPHAHAVLEFAPEFERSPAIPLAFEVDRNLNTLDPYEGILFHGESLQLIDSVVMSDEDRFVATLQLHGDPESWDSQFKASSWSAQAPLLDAVFQGAIVWSSLSQSSRCLPSKFNRAVFYQAWKPQKAILDLHIRQEGEHKLVADAKVWALDGQLIAEVLGFEATLDASLAASFAQKVLLTEDDASNAKGHV